MTNDKNSPLFNESVKEDYLSGLKEGTQENYRRIFRKTQNHESALNKDINSFSLKEVETVLYSFKSKSRNTIETYGRIISAYLNWCVDNGLTSNNVLKNFNPTDFEKYVVKDAVYMAESRLRRVEDRCENYQDAVIFRLLFMGVGGKQLSEIRNLKKKDINFEDKKLKLTNTLKADEFGNPEKFTERYVDIDDRTIYLLEGAMNQKKYLKKNGDIAETETNNIRPFTDLVENEYVIRASITKTDNFNFPVDIFVIYRRIQMIAEFMGLEELNAKFIQRSGMIYYANTLVDQEDISLFDLKMIADRFNMKSYHNLKGYITMENIRKSYPTLEPEEVE